MDTFMRFIKKISRCFTLYRGKRLENSGLNGYQHPYLLAVCDQPGISQEQLAGRLYVNKSNVARQLSALEQGGFIRRESDAADRRLLRVFPTEKAEALIPSIRKVTEEWNSGLLQDLSAAEQEQLLALLETIAQRAAEQAMAEGRPESR